MLACKNNDYNIFKALAYIRLDVNAVDGAGRTALHHSCFSGCHCGGVFDFTRLGANFPNCPRAAQCCWWYISRKVMDAGESRHHHRDLGHFLVNIMCAEVDIADGEASLLSCDSVSSRWNRRVPFGPFRQLFKHRTVQIGNIIRIGSQFVLPWCQCKFHTVLGGHRHFERQFWSNTR